MSLKRFVEGELGLSVVARRLDVIHRYMPSCRQLTLDPSAGSSKKEHYYVRGQQRDFLTIRR